MKIDAKEISRKLNGLRLFMGDTYINEKDFRKELKKIGLPINMLFWSEFVKGGIVHKMNKKFGFINPNTPVHYNKIETIYSIYNDRANSYSRKYYAKKKMAKKTHSKEILNAVKLLSDLGYQIYEPVGTLYAKL